MKKHCTAIVLSAGHGKRMESTVQKQYMELKGRPVLSYSLSTFEKSSVVDDIILVVGEGQEGYVRREVVDRYQITKVRAIVPGGRERYHSVWQGIQALPEDEEGYLFIHDGARPFVDEAILRRGYEAAEKHKACVAGMPSKDTVKLADKENFAAETPDRKYVWIVQTPQIFEKSLVREAYFRLMQKENIDVTDDAMVVEQMLHMPVKLFEGSYQNIKITTPEDMRIAEVLVGDGVK